MHVHAARLLLLGAVTDVRVPQVGGQELVHERNARQQFVLAGCLKNVGGGQLQELEALRLPFLQQRWHWFRLGMQCVQA